MQLKYRVALYKKDGTLWNADKMFGKDEKRFPLYDDPKSALELARDYFCRFGGSHEFEAYGIICLECL